MTYHSKDCLLDIERGTMITDINKLLRENDYYCYLEDIIVKDLGEKHKDLDYLYIFDFKYGPTLIRLRYAIDEDSYKQCGDYADTELSHIIEQVLDSYLDANKQEKEITYTKYEEVNHNIDSPYHYELESGKEVIEVLNDTLSEEEYKGYCKGNVIKYITRYEKKNGIEDLKKAIKYINFLIEKEKNNEK